MTPFEEGYDCCDSGGFIDENPYVAHTEAWRQWNDGFVECDDTYDGYYYDDYDLEDLYGYRYIDGYEDRYWD